MSVPKRPLHEAVIDWVLIALLAGLILSVILWAFPTRAQAVAPRQRTARTLRPDQVEAAMSNAPAGAKVQYPRDHRYFESLLASIGQREGDRIIDSVATNPPAAEAREDLRPVRVAMRCACGGEMRVVDDFSPRSPLTPARWPHKCDACGAEAVYGRAYPAISFEPEKKEETKTK
jgi:hypothetical protein